MHSQESIRTQNILYTYHSNNLEYTRKTATATQEIDSIPIIAIPGIQNRSCPRAITVGTAGRTIYRTMAFKGSRLKPKGTLATDSLRKRTPSNFPCSNDTWQYAPS